MSLLARTRRFYGRLNRIPAARRYLELLDRDVEVRLPGEVVCISVRRGRLTVRPGPARQPDRTVIATDAETWQKLISSTLRFSDTGGGLGGGPSRVVEGKGSWTDMSWLGILTRLAQEHR